MRGSRRGGGGGGGGLSIGQKSSDKFFFFFFLAFFLVLSLFYRNQIVNFKEKYHFFKFPEGVQICPGGGVQLFPGGGGGRIAYSL